MSYRQQIRCTARRSSDGQPCQRWAMLGQRVCPMHGGSAPRARAAGARNAAEAKAMVALQRQGAKPIGNPLEALQELAAEVVTVKDFLGGRVEVLQELRYRGLGGEEIRGELVAYERALDRSIRVLSEIARLNIDERLAQVTEGQAALMANVLEAALTRFGFEGESRSAARGLLSAMLRVSDQPGSAVLPADVAVEVEAVRLQVTLPDRTAVLQDELWTVRAELEAVQGQRDGLLDVIRRRGSGAPLAIEPAPMVPDPSLAGLLAGDIPKVDAETSAVVEPAPPSSSDPFVLSLNVLVGEQWDDD